MNRRSLLWTIAPPMFAILAVAIALVTGFTGRSVRTYFLTRTAADLHNQARLTIGEFAPLVASHATAAIQAQCRSFGAVSGVRFTVIAADGTVLGDSQGDPRAMENHAGRPEVAAALSGQPGRADRFSATVGNRRLYVAVPAPGDPVPFVVRTSVSLADLNDLIGSINRRIVVAGLALLLIAGVAVLLFSRSAGMSLRRLREAAEKLADGDFGVDLDVGGPSEIIAVGEAMQHMAGRLQEQLETIAAERNELQAVMSSMVEGVLAVDCDEVVFGLNNSGARMLGVEVRAAMGRTIQEVGRNPRLTALVQEVLADSRTHECDIHLTIPGERWVQVHGTPLLSADGALLGGLLVLNDITRLRRLENMRRDFVANVSHELKTPITAIRGFSETLLEDPPDDEQERRRFLSIIIAQADRLEAIISDLLDLSRLEQETDQGTLERTPTSLAPLLERVVQDARDSRSTAEGRIDLACPADLTADVNPRLVAQAVGNLLANALKYSPQDSPVTLACRREGDQVLIAVTDRGPGIAAEHLPRLCERFYRVDKARSRQLGGTGLGLAIVKHIAQAHGGRLDIRSEPGKGSTFTLILPAEVPA